MQKSLDHLDFIIKNSSTTQTYLEGKELDAIKMFCACMLERLNNVSKGVKELLPKINSIPTLDFSCGLILRSSMLDYLLTIAIYKIIYENERDNIDFFTGKERVEEFCHNALSDGLPQTLAFIKAAVESKILTSEKEKEIYNNLKYNYPKFFIEGNNDETGPILKSKKKVNARELFKDIANHPDISDLAFVYDLYVYFSKYDHFGILYYDIIRVSHIDKLNLFSKSIELMVNAQAFLHLALRLYSDDDKILIHQSEVSTNYLMSNIMNTK